MRLYKVRGWVNQRNRDGRIEHTYHFEEVFTKKPRAMEVFRETKNRVRTWEGLRGIEGGKAEVFVPHIHENGVIAYFPRDKHQKKYIEQYAFGSLKTN